VCGVGEAPPRLATQARSTLALSLARLRPFHDRVERGSLAAAKALDDAEVEGAYRFFGNANVTPDAILRWVLADDERHLREAARGAALTAPCLYPGGQSSMAKGKRHPARQERVAKLSFAATAIAIPRTGKAKAATLSVLQLNVIDVVERRPPPGEPAVEWSC
jgi:hypothetical protein